MRIYTTPDVAEHIRNSGYSCGAALMLSEFHTCTAYGYDTSLAITPNTLVRLGSKTVMMDKDNFVGFVPDNRPVPVALNFLERIAKKGQRS